MHCYSLLSLLLGNLLQRQIYCLLVFYLYPQITVDLHSPAAHIRLFLCTAYPLPARKTLYTLPGQSSSLIVLLHTGVQALRCQLELFHLSLLRKGQGLHPVSLHTLPCIIRLYLQIVLRRETPLPLRCCLHLGRRQLLVCRLYLRYKPLSVFLPLISLLLLLSLSFLCFPSLSLPILQDQRLLSYRIHYLC